MSKKRKKSDFLLKILMSIVFLVGICLLLYPTVSNMWNEHHATKAIAGYNQTIESMEEGRRAHMLEEALAYNRQLLSNTGRFNPTEEETTHYNSVLDATGTGIMAYVEIPAIDVKLPIYHGTDETVLQIAAGHLEGSSLPVGGAGSHTAVSGHCGLPSAKLFTKLDKLVEGDMFYVHVLGDTLAYRVDQIEVALPEDLTLLEIDPEKDYVTLVTCTPYGINSHRLLVRGARVELPKEETATEEVTTQEAEEADVPWFVVVIGIVLLFLGIKAVFSHKPSPVENEEAK